MDTANQEAPHAIPQPNEEWVRTCDAETRFGYSRNHLHRLTRSGEIRTKRGPNNEVWYSAQSLDAYKTQMAKKGNAKFAPHGASGSALNSGPPSTGPVTPDAATEELPPASRAEILTAITPAPDPEVSTGHAIVPVGMPPETVVDPSAATELPDEQLDSMTPPPCGMIAGRYHLTDSLDLVLGEIPKPIFNTVTNLTYQDVVRLCQQKPLMQNFTDEERGKQVTRHLGIKLVPMGRQQSVFSHGDNIIIVRSRRRSDNASEVMEYTLMRTTI